MMIKANSVKAEDAKPRALRFKTKAAGLPKLQIQCNVLALFGDQSELF